MISAGSRCFFALRLEDGHVPTLRRLLHFGLLSQGLGAEVLLTTALPKPAGPVTDCRDLLSKNPLKS